MPKDVNMLENAEQRQPERFEFDERFQWYQVDKFLLDFARMGTNLAIEPSDVVHLGGTANFYRCYEAFGPQAVQHFRGTHDMDIVSFQPGVVNRILDGLVDSYKKEQGRLGSNSKVRISRVNSYSSRPSLSLPDKKSFYVALDYQDSPGIASGFEIDVYESSADEIRFNNRKLTRDKIIFDPPQTLRLATLAQGKDRGAVSVPSLRDYLITKTDIVDFSLSGLRIKDQFDILTLLKICGVQGVDFNHLVTSLIKANLISSVIPKLQALAKLFEDPYSKLQNVPADYPFFPDKEQIRYARTVVNQTLLRLR